MNQLINNSKNLFKLILKPECLWAEIARRKLEKKHKSKNAKIGLYTFLQNSSTGKNVYINHHVLLRNSFLGDYSYIDSDTKLINTKVGKFCSIGSNVKSGLGKHPTDFVSSHPVFYSKDKPFKTFADKEYIKEYEDIIVGNDVWISRDVIIMDGVKIGDGAIIGAGAIVTKDVLPYTIVAGVPAKILKYRFHEDVIEKLLKTRWWDRSDDWLENNFKLFHDVDGFLKAESIK